ncbi:ABC transporter permease [Campylobacter canadensis]|uniref:ABC transporter permease n=1 Tax=Campylobacter canadensis TaxID=449520 RepID=UPI001555A5E9|nr:ABC transporter permease [Campylobacter canadensis]MBZ7994261.1 ABC transporter permease [Campylobacter canadensis]MBZ7999593.1 ABC transporter permease [Campylobacter canadensis]MBZ8001320.1 ABC transporter permease [Campylobacter canadensis]MBZ8004283.1 ABC transporter permease [Campylobacter canadensis]
MIKLKCVNKFYGSTQVLKDINLSISAGEFVILLGKSGSGKSTLLNMIGLIDEPNSGEYYFKDKNLYKLNKEEKSAFRSMNFGFIFQRYNLMPSSSVLDNVILSALYAKKNKEESIKRAKELLNNLELAEHINKKAAHLSGGQQQRVSVARALINKASFILADEPTGALDSLNGIKLMEILKELNEKEGVGVILVTHDETLCKYASRVIKMKDGNIISDEILKEKSKVEFKKTEEKPSTFKDKFIASSSFFLQNVSLALNNLITHKMRSFLTMLGLIIATASVISTIALGNGGKADVLAEISFLGNNQIIVHKGARDGDRNTARLRDLKLSDLELIKKLDYVKDVGIESSFPGAYVTYKDKEINVGATGVFANFLEINNKQMLEGRFFNDDEEAQAKNICVLSQSVKETLFKNNEDPIGKIIYLKGKPLKVIGVIKKDNQDRDFDIKVYLPNNTLSKKFDGRRDIRQIIVLVKDGVDSTFAESNLKQVLEVKKGENSIRTFNLDAIKKTIEKTAQKLSLLIFGVAFIAMIVGGIGVMNIMLVVVKERTKEIGIKLAIGASPSYISTGFLIEAVVLCSVAAILGVLFSLAIIFTINNLNFIDINMMIDYKAILLGFFSSVIVGLFFGYFPAKSASKLIPAQALSDE